MHYVYNGKVYVAGGFCKNGKRAETIECYDEKDDVWLLLGKKIIFYLQTNIIYKQYIIQI